VPIFLGLGFGTSPSGREAFRWTAATGMVGLGDLAGGSFASFGFGVSADGSVIVGRGASASGPAVSDDGSVVAGRFGNEAYLWDATHGARSIQDLLENRGLDLTGWPLIEATDVSADGRTLVGLGTNPSGSFEAWVVVVPGPPPAALVLLGLLAAAPRLRRGVRARLERR
jgi:uncharacterized membrane protein